MGKSKLEFYAKITTSDGREITKRVAEDIPDDLTLENLDEFMSTFDDYEYTRFLSPSMLLSKFSFHFYFYLTFNIRHLRFLYF